MCHDEWIDDDNDESLLIHGLLLLSSMSIFVHGFFGAFYFYRKYSIVCYSKSNTATAIVIKPYIHLLALTDLST